MGQQLSKDTEDINCPDGYDKETFDKNGLFATKGKLIKNIINKFNQDIFFKQKYPKSRIVYTSGRAESELLDEKARN